jgi:predicted dehydrogenase
MSLGKKITRRRMLKGLGIAVAAPLIVPSRVFGAADRINLGMVGVGRQGLKANLKTLVHMREKKYGGVYITAVCDVDRWRMQNAKEAVDKVYGNSDCRMIADWREVIARDDIDAVMVSTTDHWHVPISLSAVRAGKHVSCEKPLTLSIAEGRVLADAAKKHGVVFRTDSECRSHAYMHKTAQLVRNGYIGNVKKVVVGIPRGDKAGGKATAAPVPSDLDYEMWMGPIARKPYMVDAVHHPRKYGRPGWMRCQDTCEGMVTNWGTHLLDVAQLALNTERTGPVSVEGTGTYPKPGSGLWNVLLDMKVQFKYANGVVLDYIIDVPYLRIEGDEGWIQAHWYSKGGLKAHDKSIFRIKLKDSDIKLPQRGDKADFIYGIRNEAPTMADAEVGHRTCSMGQLAHIAIKRGRRLDWDPAAERFAGDAEANKMLERSYRDPWGLDIRISTSG